MSVGEWVGLISVVATVLLAVVASYVALASKLTRVEAAVTTLGKRSDENRQDHKEIWSRLDEYGNRVAKLEVLVNN